MIWELVLTIMLHGEPREIDWRSLERQQSCEEQAQWLNARASFSSYHGAKAFCREVPRWRAHPSRSTTVGPLKR